MPHSPVRDLARDTFLLETIRGTIQRLAAEPEPASGVVTLEIPAGAVHGLLGMLSAGGAAEYAYRRRQFVDGFGLHLLRAGRDTTGPDVTRTGPTWDIALGATEFPSAGAAPG